MMSYGATGLGQLDLVNIGSGNGLVTDGQLDLVNIGSGNGLVTDGTKPLPEPTLTSY